MSSMNPLSNQPLVNLFPGGEVLAPTLDNNPELLGTSAGSSISEIMSGYDQLIHAPVQLCYFWLPSVQMTQQPSFPPHEVQAHSNGGYLSVHNAPERHRKICKTGEKRRYGCLECSKDFARVQELRRHVRDKHKPSRQCPFCNFLWTRPCKITSHLLANHAEKFPPDILESLRTKTLCGERVIKLVNGYYHGPDVEVTLRCPNLEASQLSFLQQAPSEPINTPAARCSYSLNVTE